MTEGNDQDTGKGRLSLRPAGRLELGRTVDAGSVRQSFSHGRSKVVQVEVRKKRAHPGPGSGPASGPAQSGGGQAASPAAPSRVPSSAGRQPGGRALTATELATRQRALVEQQREAARREAERKISILSAAEEARRREEEARKAAEEEARRKAEQELKEKAEAEARQAAEAAASAAAVARTADEARRRPAPTAAVAPTETLRLKTGRGAEEDDEARPVRRPGTVLPARKPQIPTPKKGVEDRRRAARIDVQAAIEGDDERVRSLAPVVASRSGVGRGVSRRRG